MSPEQAPIRVIRVQIGIGVAVMNPVGFGPPKAGSLYGTCPAKEQEKPKRDRSGIRAVRP
jgi:hypothetical protein